MDTVRRTTAATDDHTGTHFDSMLQRRFLTLLLIPVAALALETATPGSEASAQQRRAAPEVLSHPDVRASPVVARGDYLVVVDLDENMLHFLHGRNVLWSAPVGTGMDLRLETEQRNWTFSTPTGEYDVQYKEENPVWNAPDWYFIENKLPVPPQGDPRRRLPGALGVAAVHFGRGLAIHGTDKPDLLGQRISHGCIRLANEYAQRLYHNVQVGTKVLIVGTETREARGRLEPGNVPGAGPVDARTQRMRDRIKAERTALLAGLNAAETGALLERLAAELNGDREGRAHWTETASVLVRRAVADGDMDAARGILARSARVRDAVVRAELATYAADLYRRATPLAAAALASLPPRERDAAAEVIVSSTLGLFAAGAEVATAPWPSRRVLRSVLDPEGRRGWDAIHSAEARYRDGRLTTRAPAQRTGRLE
jgi:lipoprotein-anchoring transpeptidase ErfK/SrfK